VAHLLRPQTIDLDPFDFADTVADLFEQTLTDAIELLTLPGPPAT
jgi:hypothetical protein